MVTLRCTRKLLGRLGPPSPAASQSTEAATVLGDWYATVFVAARRPLVLAAAERSLCPVVLPLKEAGTLVLRWREAVGRKLAALGVAPARVAAELAAMPRGPSSWRRLLGSVARDRVPPPSTICRTPGGAPGRRLGVRAGP